MKVVTYDCEVFKHDWLVIFKDWESKHYTVIHNDNDALSDCMNTDTIYFGFNCKHYDQYIIKAIIAGFSPEQVRKVNDFIINGNQGWNYEPLKDVYYPFANIDIRDDMQNGLSLKAIEGHLGLSVKESTVSFDLDRPLTQKELEETIYYCKHDIDATEKLIDMRSAYLKNKAHLGKIVSMDEVKAMSLTNAKLTAVFLGAKPQKHDDERKYMYPDNLKREYIPQNVFDFFDRMKDKSISDNELFSSKLEFSIGKAEGIIGYGGIHAAIPHYFKESNERTVIVNMDVGSYYPHLCTINGYTSRNIPSAETYKNVLDTRMKAKKDGDTATASALKLVCNTTYGATLNKYNDLYDPLMARSVCISGQLYLLELANHCCKDVESLKVIQLNTDGIMVEVDKKDLPAFKTICNEWHNRTGFDLEETYIQKIAQKDVNNYAELQSDGTEKVKGGYLARGQSMGSAFNLNHNFDIVATALKDYLLYDTPVEKTINECTDIFQFQFIAKAGSKYKEVYQLVRNNKIPQQNVNRVYAGKDKTLGTLYKVKAENDMVAKIEMLPDHCIVDNDNTLTIDDIDKQVYIDMANKRINDFKGIQPEKKRRTNKMATENVYQKLLKARTQFLENDIQKTGKNMYLSFKYFELEDIVPIATRIFKDVGIVPIVNITEDTATMTIINVDDANDSVSFSAPFNQIKPIVSNQGKEATNEMQALGASITYMRRYLYMIALDICENDTIDANLGADEKPQPQKKQAPPTPQERKNVAKQLTNTDGDANELQLKGLKKVCKTLRDLDPTREEMITQVAIETQSFTKVSKKKCEELINQVNEMIKESSV